MKSANNILSEKIDSLNNLIEEQQSHIKSQGDINRKLYIQNADLVAAMEGILDINNPPWGDPEHIDFTTAIKMGRKALTQVGGK